MKELADLLSISNAIYIAVCVLVVMIIFLVKLGIYKGARWRVSLSKRWLKKYRKNSHHTRQEKFSYLRKVNCYLWEDILMSCFEERGFKIERTSYSRDGGIDGVVYIDTMKIVIQAKRYDDYISKSDVLKLDKLVNSDSSISKGVFIHTGKSSKPVLEIFKNSNTLELISGMDKLLTFLDGKEINLFGIKLNGI